MEYRYTYDNWGGISGVFPAEPEEQPKPKRKPKPKAELEPEPKEDECPR